MIVDISGFRIPSNALHIRLLTAKYKYMVLALFFDVTMRILYQQSKLSDLSHNNTLSLQQMQQTELLHLWKLFEAALSCLSSWCAYTNTDLHNAQEEEEMDTADDDVDTPNASVTLEDIIEAEINADYTTMLRSLCVADTQLFCDFTRQTSVISLLFEVLAPKMFNIYIEHCQYSEAEGMIPFHSSIRSTCVSSIVVLLELLQDLFGVKTTTYYTIEASKQSQFEAMQMSPTAGDTSMFRKICQLNVIMVSSIATCWEIIFGMPLRSVVSMVTSWAVQSDSSPDQSCIISNNIMKDIHRRLLDVGFCRSMLWSEIINFNDRFGLPSPLLHILVELTVFICEKQSVSLNLVSFFNTACML